MHFKGWLCDDHTINEFQFDIVVMFLLRIRCFTGGIGDEKNDGHNGR